MMLGMAEAKEHEGDFDKIVEVMKAHGHDVIDEDSEYDFCYKIG